MVVLNYLTRVLFSMTYYSGFKQTKAGTFNTVHAYFLNQDFTDFN